MVRECSNCKVPKVIEDSFRPHPTGRGGFMAKCRQCESNEGNARNKRNAAKTSHERSAIKWRFGITLEDKHKILVKQGMACAICRSPDSFGKKKRVPSAFPDADGWAIDHDHVTLEIRGVLCNRCNPMIGYAKDSTETLKSAIAYLESGVVYGIAKR